MTSAPVSSAYLSCDWGTSHLRLRLVEGADGSGREVRSDDGAARLAEGEGGEARAGRFELALQQSLERLQPPPGLPILISGMASSSIGWKEIPYARLPFALDGSDAQVERIADRIHLVSGVCSADDMMRGEETQAIGLADFLGSALPPRAIFILPGTHSKHLDVAGGRITSVRTFMTGELFELLSRRSVLRHSTDPEAPFEPGPFLDGVRAAERAPFTSALFQIRTRQVLRQLPPSANSAFLSGLLIGAELGSLRRGGAASVPGLAGSPDVELAPRVFLAAPEALRAAYASAAAALGLGDRFQDHPSDALTARGHGVLQRRHRERSRGHR